MPKDLDALLLHTLKDVYFAENAITKALPKMRDAARSDELRNAFETHLQETQEQIKRLEQIFKLIRHKPEAVPCEAIQGILKEGEEVAAEFSGEPALDAGLIAAAQAVEHYEIARYGAMYAWADQLGLDEVAELLEQTLEEEEDTDALLTEISEGSVNGRAEDNEADDDDEEEEDGDEEETERRG